MNKELHRAHYGKQSLRKMQQQQIASNLANKNFQPGDRNDKTFSQEFARRWQMNEEELEQFNQKYDQYENKLKKLQVHYLPQAKFGEHRHLWESDYERRYIKRMKKHKKINQFNSFEEFSLN